jgi:hypothetical protein
MAHSLNLAAKHVLETFAPTPYRILAKGEYSRAAEPADVDQDEIESDEEEDDEGDENELVDFKPGDLLGKVHAFVTQACPHFDGSCHVVSDSSHFCRCASPHKPAHSSPSNASQPTCLGWSFSGGVAHDGRQ